MVTSIVSKMIWNEELQASFDHASGVVVFHRIELTRSHQLAQILADKVNNMVEQNEKALDQKLGNTTNWNDRGDGQKGDKRGEQTQERRRGGERRGGIRGMSLLRSRPFTYSREPAGGARGGRGARFAQGLGSQMAGAQRSRA